MFQLLEGEMERGVNPPEKRFFFKREVQAADIPDVVRPDAAVPQQQRHLQQRLVAPAH